MSDAPKIVNLRRARKARARAETRAAADANAARHGTPKPARDLAEARRAKAERELDGHRRSPAEAPADPPSEPGDPEA